MYIIGEGSESDKDALPLAARDGWHIPNRVAPSRPLAAMAEARRLHEQIEGVRCMSLASHYSCAGLVFGSRRTFIDVDHVREILRRDGYALVDRSDARVGDVVLYTKGKRNEVEHVGLIAEESDSLTLGRRVLRVLSQWGRDGEYLHEIDSVPMLFGNASEFWTARCL